MKRKILTKKKVIILVLFLMLVSGCSSDNVRLSETENPLEQSMKNYFSETELPLYSGEFIEIKVRDCIKYDYNGNEVYVYDLLIAPIYDRKTVISGISLDSLEFPKKFSKLYYEMNHVYASLNKSLHTYKKTEDILCNEFQFMIVNNSWLYGFEISEEEFESCIRNITVTVKINGRKDRIELKNLEFHDYKETDKENRCIKTLNQTGRLSASLSAYIHY